VSHHLAAVVLTKNEERHIADCLASLAWAEQRIVFDAHSTDRTVALAQSRGAEVIQHPFQNFAAQRNAALEAVDAAWIFFVDADERAEPGLGEEILQVIQDERRVGWWVPRHNVILGHTMRGGGWYPDHQLRLLRRGWARYDPVREVHEVVLLDGKAGHLEHHLTHYNYDSLAQFRRKQNRYADLQVRVLQRQGVRVRPWTPLSMPVREFWRRFVTLHGYRDGLYGVLLCGLVAYYYGFLPYLRLVRS
jgi:glycosyltransferase involved in cell wall biosynthesis